MEKKIRGYLAFAPIIYRVLTMLILPCVMIALRIWHQFTSGAEEDVFWLFEILIAYFYIMLELVLDYWLFGGICCRDVGQPILLKTSARGFGLLRDGLVGDLVRRFVWIMGYSLVGYLLSGEVRELVTGLLMYLVVTANLNLSRHVQNPQHLLLAAQPGVVLFMMIRLPGLMMETTGKSEVYFLETLLLLVAAAGVSVVTIWHMLYFLKKSRSE